MKRKAESQLTPKSTFEEEVKVKNIKNDKVETDTSKECKNDQLVVSEDKLKKIFGSLPKDGKIPKAFKDLKASVLKEKNNYIASLNQAFYTAINSVLKVQANKNLIYLFEQYKELYELIEKYPNFSEYVKSNPDKFKSARWKIRLINE